MGKPPSWRIERRCPNEERHHDAAEPWPIPCPTCYSVEIKEREVPFQMYGPFDFGDLPEGPTWWEHNDIHRLDRGEYRTLLTAELTPAGDGLYDDGRAPRLGVEPDDPKVDPVLISSEKWDGPDRVGQDDSGDRVHYPAIDIDHECVLIQSSTPGHFHLYINKAVPWRKYINMLIWMAEAGIVEDGYVEAAKRRRATHLRLPWVKKETVEIAEDEAQKEYRKP